MPSTYLQLVQTACNELGLAAPSVVAGSTSLQIIQFGALFNRDLRELQQNYEWTALQNEFDLYVAQPTNYIGTTTLGSYFVTNIKLAPISQGTDFNSDYNVDFGGGTGNDFNSDFSSDFSGGNSLSTIAANPNLYLISGQSIVNNTRITALDPVGLTITMDQPATGTNVNVIVTISQDTYPGPTDFSRYINQTWWDRTNRWALIGPDSPQVDQWHRSGIVTIGPRRHFRQIGYNGLTQAGGARNNYRIWPAPGATDTPLNLVYEYISKNPVLSEALVPQEKFTADTDFCVLDENMLILGAKWRMWQIKGFDYAALQSEYIDYCDRCYANDGGAKTLSMVGSRVGLYQSLIQDGNYPGTATSGQ